MKPWAELSSDERLDAVLLAVWRLDEELKDATGNAIAYEVERLHVMSWPRSGNHGRGNVARQMSKATRVTPSITALRNRGLIRLVGRTDGWSGSADVLTAGGRARVFELRRKTNEEGKMATIDELKVKLREATGFDDEEEAVAEHEGFTYGDRVRVIEDDEEEGVFAGDAGHVVISKVGAAEFGNERVALYVLPDGMSAPVEVAPDNIEPA